MGRLLLRKWTASDPLYTVMDKKNFQVIEKCELQENGDVKQVLELLREGEIIEIDGLRYQVVKNELGTLYKKSIRPQIGEIQAGMTAKELNDAILTDFNRVSPDLGASMLSALDFAKKQPEFTTPVLVIQDIQPLYRDRFNIQAQEAVKKVKNSLLAVETTPTGNQVVWSTVFGAVIISDQKHREEAITTLIDAINDLAARGWIASVFKPLSSMVFAVQDTEGPFNNFLERLAAPIKRYDEHVFFWPHVRVPFDQIKDLYPKIFTQEGVIPEPFVPKSITLLPDPDGFYRGDIK